MQMRVSTTINRVPAEFEAAPGERVQHLLKRLGYMSVRDSDDGEGFAGSDTILVDGIPMYASLLSVAQIAGKQILTPESLANGRTLSVVQQAMVDAGVVQSGYNAPAAALLLTELLNRNPDPSDEDVADTLSGLFNRATGYKQFFNAVRIAKNRMSDPSYAGEIAPEFRDDYRVVGKVREKVDGESSLPVGRPSSRIWWSPVLLRSRCSEVPMPMHISPPSRHRRHSLSWRVGSHHTRELS